MPAKKVDIAYLEHKAYNLRKLSLLATSHAGSGHPTSALSSADIVAALFFYQMHLDISNPHNPTNDRFILSKGHAVPVVYAAWEQLGVVSEEELLRLRKFDSVLEGHPTPRFVYNEASTGSLGIGLSIGLGMALSARQQEKSFNVYVMLGDSEMAEGSVWEACELAAYYKAHNLIAIVDVNRLGQTTQTLEGWNTQDFENKFTAFGFDAQVIDGHDMKSIIKALDASLKLNDKPKVIIAKTIKGYGLASIENKVGYHGKAFTKSELPSVLAELENRFNDAAKYPDNQPERIVPHIKKREYSILPVLSSPYKIGEKIATRKAYGSALTALGGLNKYIMSLDAEVKNSTFAELFEQQFPERFLQCFIAEQNMIGMATGLALRWFIPFCSTFGAFFTRAHDHIRMAAIGHAPLRLAGSHCGASIGEDGPSQMALEDISMIRAIPHSIVLYPSDGTSTFKLMTIMANYHDGISYLRLTRAETNVIYADTEEFMLGGSKIVKHSPQDKLCVVAAGITLHEALKAYEELKKEGIDIAVIDAYSIKPLDQVTIKRIAEKSQRKVITVEDHYVQGGLGEAVCSSFINDQLEIRNLAVMEFSRSGSPAELLAYHQIDAQSIIRTVKEMI